MAADTGSLSTIGGSQARDSFEAGLAELGRLSEVAPSKMSDSLMTIESAYKAVQIELTSLNWDTTEYLSTTEARSQMDAIAGQAVAQAIAKVGVDASLRCKFDLEFNAETADTLVTLPQPAVPDDSLPDITIEPTDGDSATIAMGLVIADRFEVAVTDAEALCAGNAFNKSTVDGNMDEIALDTFYRNILSSCGVSVP